MHEYKYMDLQFNNVFSHLITEKNKQVTSHRFANALRGKNAILKIYIISNASGIKPKPLGAVS